MNGVERIGMVERKVRVNFNKAKFMSPRTARHVFMNDMRAMILKRAKRGDDIDMLHFLGDMNTSAKPRTQV
jgi:hypothetical protein